MSDASSLSGRTASIAPVRALVSLIRHTSADILRHKSFYILLGISIVFLLLLRSCYQGEMTVNGQRLNRLEIAWNASQAAFHIVGVGGMLIAIMLGMSILRHDRDEGPRVMDLTRAVPRGAYVFSRILGVWIVSSVFMFLLHLTIFLITLLSAGGTVPGYLTGSLICFPNLLLMTCVVLLCASVMPEFVAVILCLGLVGIGVVIDAASCAVSPENASQVLESIPKTPVVTALHAVGIAWPKMTALQCVAGSLMTAKPAHFLGPIHPAINVAVYTVIAAALLFVRLRREEY